MIFFQIYLSQYQWMKVVVLENFPTTSKGIQRMVDHVLKFWLWWKAQLQLPYDGIGFSKKK